MMCRIIRHISIHFHFILLLFKKLHKYIYIISTKNSINHLFTLRPALKCSFHKKIARLLGSYNLSNFTKYLTPTLCSTYDVIGTL